MALFYNKLFLSVPLLKFYQEISMHTHFCQHDDQHFQYTHIKTMHCTFTEKILHTHVRNWFIQPVLKCVCKRPKSDKTVA